MLSSEVPDACACSPQRTRDTVSRPVEMQLVQIGVDQIQVEMIDGLLAVEIEIAVEIERHVRVVRRDFPGKPPVLETAVQRNVPIGVIVELELRNPGAGIHPKTLSELPAHVGRERDPAQLGSLEQPSDAEVGRIQPTLETGRAALDRTNVEIDRSLARIGLQAAVGSEIAEQPVEMARKGDPPHPLDERQAFPQRASRYVLHEVLDIGRIGM